MLTEGRTFSGTTPQQRDRKSSACSLGVGARMGCLGRKRETMQAVDPDQVGVMIAAAPVSLAIKCAARLIAPLVPGSTGRFSKASGDRKSVV